MGLFDKIFGNYSQKEIKRIQPLADKVLALEDSYAALSDAELKATTGKLKERLANGATLDELLPEAFAACREAAWRTIGMKHFPVQVLGGIILHQGRIAEMKTGEGKTLVATLPVYLNALTGKGVHVVTVNDYLAKRDSEWMGKVYRFLGLSVGLIVNGLTPEERQKAYAADITYGTNNEFGFDYLRDNMVTYKQNQVQRGHNFAIVDEVDSILVDEARTPLIISGIGDKSTDLYSVADHFAKGLRIIKVKEMDDKADNDVLDGDYIVDEKARTATLTQSGIKKAESYFHVDNLMDMENATILHHVNQAIKARGVMRRDVDYVVKDGQVIIVDEFTGRLMIGRRYNEGLHQAIEAKEGVKVERESQTLATITFQNYFRMYTKLAGMTGTAMTEAEEFEEIYKLDVVEIPTNKPLARTDDPDVVYKTEEGKFNAVIEQIAACHEKGQPVLVGTVSIDKSEHLSDMLKKRGIHHAVLNAKLHEKEAQIVAQAGKFGAVTIATNMAGRGTDIVLGGNPEYLAKDELAKQGFPEEVINEATGYADTEDEQVLQARAAYHTAYDRFRQETDREAEQVKAAGGLFIIGTERHEARRIDNQLRGRSGRQGDNGETRFYLSLEDDLMRLFGGERIQMLMNSLGVEEDMPIENKMLTGTIESAQRKLEGRNFGIRKNVLQFDDVMNRQREVIYAERGKVLDGESVRDSIMKMIDETIENNVQLYLADSEIHDDWNLDGLRRYYAGWILDHDDLRYDRQQLAAVTREEIRDLIRQKAHTRYEEKEQAFTPEIMREVERIVLLRNVDEHWKDHIDSMDQLKQGIYLRGYGQHDPVVEYRMEGADMFDSMIASIREETVKMMFRVQLNTNQPLERKAVATPTNVGGDDTIKKQPVKKGVKVGRNDPCPCGSGKKYKKCCGA